MMSNSNLKKKILSKLITEKGYNKTSLSQLVLKKDIGDGDWILSDDMCTQSNNKLIQLGSIGFGKYIEKPFKYIDNETFDRIKCSEVKEGDLLINRFISNNQMGACIIPKIEDRLLTSVDVCWIKENKEKYNNKYLMYCFLTDEVQREVILKSSGTTRIRISKNNLIKIEIPLPPFEEQKRIVERIEELFTLIDKKEKNDLETEKLKNVLKDKILDNAFNGTLINSNNSNAWKNVVFSDVIDVRDGTHDSPKYVEYSNYPLITSKNLTNKGLDFSNVNYLKEEDYNLINQRSYVDNGDVLFAMIGSIGNPVLVNKNRNFAIKNVALFKCKSEIYNKFLYYFLLHEKDMKDKTKGGVQKFVSLKILRSYPIKLPPLEEQKKIVEKIENLFELIEQL